MQQMNVCVSVCIYVHVCVWGGAYVHVCVCFEGAAFSRLKEN